MQVDQPELLGEGWSGCKCSGSDYSYPLRHRLPSYGDMSYHQVGKNNQMSETPTLTKQDVPYWARANAMWFTLAGVIFGWPASTLVWPDLRPGVAELCIGCVIARIC